MSAKCLCGKSKPHDQCCGRFLSGKQQAKTPEQLMRSRFCAYALGGYGEYLIKTWHPSVSKNLTIESLSERQCDWLRLEVLDKSQQGDKAFVEFDAYYKDFSNNEIKLLHEKSIFQRIDGYWLYIGADVSKN